MKWRFQFSPPAGEDCREVNLVGSFNNWNTAATPMTFSRAKGFWEREMDLQEGYYPYKFLVNGVDWFHDPSAPRFEQNELGSINSIAMVSHKPVRHATFSPSDPSFQDTITVYSERQASLIWSLNGWNPYPRGYLKNTIPNLEVLVSTMKSGDTPGIFEVEIGPFDKGTIPEVIAYNFVFEDGSVDDNYGKNYWIPINMKISGRCTIDHFQSRALDSDKPFRIFVPPGKKTRFPLLILLHGYGGSHMADWTQAETVKMLAERYGIVTVWPDGNVWVWGETIPSWYINSPRVPQAQVEDYIIRELIPYVESHYPCNGDRAIGGISMGGFGALYLATRYPQTFKAAGSFSAIYNLYRYRRIDALRKLVGDESVWKKNQFNVIKMVSQAKDTRFFFLIGDEERGGLRDNFNLKLAMDKSGIRNDFRIYQGNHTNNFWRVHLQEMMEFFGMNLGCIERE